LKKDADGGGGGGVELVDEDSKEGSAAYRRVMERNKLDLELFLYCQQLYKFQISLS